MDKEHLAKLLQQYGNMIFRISYTYLKNKENAEDIVQDVFVKIMEKLPDFKSTAHEKAWIIKVTINMCKNALTSYTYKNVVSINDKEISSYDSYNENSHVLQAVLSLPEKYAGMVYLYYYEGYSTVEIAKITSKSDVTVRSLLHRARTKLKAVLKEEYDFE